MFKINIDKDKTIQDIILNYKKEIQSILDKKAEIADNVDPVEFNNLEKRQTILLEELQETLYQLNKNTSTNEIDINTDINTDALSNTNTLEQEYIIYDCKEIPGYIFFHDKIIKSYGLCPFINISEMSNGSTTSTTSTTTKPVKGVKANKAKTIV